MLGIFQSDDLEQRFSWYRQMSGGNYNVSVRQVLESERKIKITSLVKFSNFNIKAIDECLYDDAYSQQHVYTEVANVLASKILASYNVQNFDQGDLAACFYVAGYAANTIRKSISCDACISLFVENNEPVTTFPLFDIACDLLMASKFTNQINRGGLVYPTDAVFYLCALTSSVFSIISNNSILKTKILCDRSPRLLFAELILIITSKIESPHNFNTVICSSYHQTSLFYKRYLYVLFNCMAKNVIKTVNFANNCTGIARKIKKFKSM